MIPGLEHLSLKELEAWLYAEMDPLAAVVAGVHDLVEQDYEMRILDLKDEVEDLVDTKIRMQEEITALEDEVSQLESKLEISE
jgi:prefoldin subunit 5